MAHLVKMPLSELAAAILQDGMIDAKEVRLLRERLGDEGPIDRSTANFLFALNDAVTGRANDPGWSALFVEAIASYLLDGEEVPGGIDLQEASWLALRMARARPIDASERALLVYLKLHVRRVPDALVSLFDRV